MMLDTLHRGTQLPRCDRFIIAAALKHELTVVMRDEWFEKYGVKVIG